VADKIISHVKIMSQSDQWKKDNGQYIPMPMTYLNRQYWDAEGLVGKSPKFGSIDQLSQAKPHQRVITELRKEVLSYLKRYQNQVGLGSIHADLHFGNTFVSNDFDVVAIDFDDCGRGFLVYDLVVPMISARRKLKSLNRDSEFMKFREALFEGYALNRSLSQEDVVAFDYLTSARHLTMLGWLESRSDNPKLKAYFPKALEEVLKYFEQF
jgi:Ser/Thr protein kinase RdoA (MazF antagonist)